MNRAFVLLALVTTLAASAMPSPSAAGATPSFRLYLPNVTKALGGEGGWSTTIAMQNSGTSPTRARLHLYRFEGELAGDLEVPQLWPGASWLFDPNAEPSLPDDAQFSAVLESGGPVAAVAVTGSTHAWMSYAAAGAGAARVELPRVLCDVDGWTSSIVIQNAGEDPADASLLLYRDDERAPAVRVEARLLPARSMPFAPCAKASGTFSGVVVGPANARLVAVANEHRTAQARSYLGLTAGAARVALPNVTKYLGGPDGWSTPFAVRNLGSEPTSLSISFRAHATGEVVSEVAPRMLEPGRALSVDPRNDPSGLPPGHYSAVVQGGPGARLAVLVDETDSESGDAMGYAGIGAALSTASLPFVQKSLGPAEWSSTIIAQNIGAAPADLTVAIFDAAGTLAVSRRYRGLPPGGAIVYEPRADPRLPSGRYSGVVRGTAPVGVLVNDAGDGSGDLAYAYVGVPAPEAPSFATPSYALETVGGMDFVAAPGARADLFLQLRAGTEPGAIAERLDADVAEIERDLGRRFSRRPQVFAFATPEDFQAGRPAVLGDVGLVDRGLGVFVAATARIGIDWSRGSVTGSAKIRHELTHLLLFEIVGLDADLPAWLNEGLARLEEQRAAGGAFLEARDRYDAASMAASGRLFRLDELAATSTWLARINTPEGRYEYAIAAQAVGFLREDLGSDGLIRLLALLGQGTGLGTAYEGLAGRPFKGFGRAFPDRIRALATRVPAIAAVPGPADEGAAFLLYGFAPSAPIAYNVTFNGIAQTRAAFEGTTDAYGRVDHLIAPGSLPGVYTIIATGANGTAGLSVALPLRSSASEPPDH